MSFGVSDKEIAATIEKMEGGRMVQSLLLSNEPTYVSHFRLLFEELWRNGIDALDRIKNIEEGVDSQGIEVIQNPVEIQMLGFQLIRSAVNEILIIFSTSNAFHRQEHAGVMELLNEAAAKQGIKTRILTPADEKIRETKEKLKERGGGQLRPQRQEPIHIRFVEPQSQTKVSVLIVDRKFSLAVELKDDSKDNSYEAVGLASYSDSKSTVLSYATIFETLWLQTELYEQLKVHDRMQNEFINIAAHELRTPIQPIVSLSEVLRSKIQRRAGEEEELLLLDTIMRNAKRLQGVTEEILDVTKIESQSMHLKNLVFSYQKA
jgi:signal transduction histidine kinase